MRTLFRRWQLPLLIFAAILGGVYSYEMWGPRSVNAAVELPLLPLLFITVGLLYVLASMVYQLAQRRWLPALITAAVLVWAAYYFLV